MHARFFIASAFALIAAAAPAPALAWGKTGHRVTAAIADAHLSGLARAHVQQILGAQSLAEASTWPDEMRSDPGEFWQKTASPWHYVTLGGFAYDEAPPVGDAVTALQRFSMVLRDPKASRRDKQLALRFVVHIIGDLHQPLHAGKPGDRGGNEVKVNWFGRSTNLHAVWDNALIDEEQMSFTEWTDRLQRHTEPQQVIDWWVGNPIVWIAESAQIRDTIYPEGDSLGYEYVYRHTPTVKRRLSQAGVRMAAYLNQLFQDAPAVEDEN